MSNIIPFSFESHQVRVIIGDDGEPLFNANDVCEALGFGNARQALDSHVDHEDVQKLDTLTAGGKQAQNHINESGLYALILGSTKPEAKRFKRWVTHEVLPTIRKTGAYIHPLADLDRLPEPIARQLGGIVKAVVSHMAQELIVNQLPAMVDAAVASQHVMVRRGMTAGQVWDKYGLPKIKGGAQMLSRRLALLNCGIAGASRAELGGRTARLFDPDKVDAQMQLGGLLPECRRYVAERMGQQSLNIVGASQHPLGRAQW